MSVLDYRYSQYRSSTYYRPNEDIFAYHKQTNGIFKAETSDSVGDIKSNNDIDGDESEGSLLASCWLKLWKDWSIKFTIPCSSQIWMVLFGWNQKVLLNSVRWFRTTIIVIFDFFRRTTIQTTIHRTVPLFLWLILWVWAKSQITVVWSFSKPFRLFSRVLIRGWKCRELALHSHTTLWTLLLIRSFLGQLIQVE